MAQQTNISSLRGRSPAFLYLSSKKKLFHFCFLFLKHFSQFLRINGVFLPKASLTFLVTRVFLRYTFFFKTSKLSFFKKKMRVFTSIKKNLMVTKAMKTFSSNSKSFFILFLRKFFLSLKNVRVFVCQAKNLHSIFKTFIGKNLLHQFFFFFKKRGYSFFPRRFTFYLDMIKLSVLFFLNKISIEFYLSLLGDIFKFVQKKRHLKFLVFLKDLFKFLIQLPVIFPFLKEYIFGSFICGAKFRLNGRLHGNPRSNSCVVLLGQQPNQTLSAAVSFAKIHSYTRYGAFGFRLWVYRSTKLFNLI